MRNLAALMGAKQTPPAVHFERAAFAIIQASARAMKRGEGREGDAKAISRQLWPDDAAALEIVTAMTRSAVDPAMTSATGHGAELVQTAFSDFLGSLAPLSAAATLISAGMELPLAYSSTAPARGTGLTALPWTGEGAPIAVRSYDLNGIEMSPRKFAGISVISRELVLRARGQEAVTQMLREDAAYSLDAGYFSTAAGTDTVHAGLLNGVTPISAYGGGDAFAFQQDIYLLLSAIMPGGSGRVVFVTGPTTAAMMSVWFPDFAREETILPSPAVPDTRFIAIDAGSLVHMAGDVTVDVSGHAVVHMDTVPLAISAGGGAAPTRSMYQTAALAIRIIGDIAFAARRANAVAYVDNFAWSSGAP